MKETQAFRDRSMALIATKPSFTECDTFLFLKNKQTKKTQ